MISLLEHLDHQLFFAVNQGLSTRGLDYLFWALSALGNGTGLLIGAAFGLWLFDRQACKRHYGWILLAVIAGGIVIQVLKYGVARPRPLREFALLLEAGEVYINVIGRPLRSRSFPSGHAQAAASVFTYLGCLYPRHWPWWGAGMVAVGLSRVYVGVHFPLDVLVGVLIGSFSAVAAVRLQRLRNAECGMRNAECGMKE